MIRRSTSLAVCCAPIEDDAERTAALGDVEQDLLDRRVALLDWRGARHGPTAPEGRYVRSAASGSVWSLRSGDLS